MGIRYRTLLAWRLGQPGSMDVWRSEKVLAATAGQGCCPRITVGTQEGNNRSRFGFSGEDRDRWEMTDP